MKKFVATIAAVFILSAGFVATGPSASAIPGGCVTLGEAVNTLEDHAQTRASITRGFGSKGSRVDGTRTAVWIDYITCVRPNNPDLYMHIIFVKRAGQWKTLYWNYFLARGFGLNRTTGTDTWTDHR